MISVPGSGSMGGNCNSDLLRLYLRMEFIEERNGLRLLPPKEHPVGLHIGLILDGL